MIVNSIAWIWYWWQFMVAWYCLVFASIVWFRLPLWKVKTDCWFQSCKALKIDSFAKNNKNNDGHGGLLKAMIIYSEVVLQFAYQEKVTKMVIGGSQLITGWYSEVTMLPLEGAAVAHKNTFFYHGQIDLLLYLCFNWQPYSESSFTLMQLKYFCITQITCKLFCWSYNS